MEISKVQIPPSPNYQIIKKKKKAEKKVVCDNFKKYVWG